MPNLKGVEVCRYIVLCFTRVPLTVMHSNILEIICQLRLMVATLLPPANEVCEGYVFTGVYLSMGEGVCVAGGHVWQGGMHGWGGHVWQGGVRGRGACMVGGCAWQGACMGVGGMCGGGTCIAAGVWLGGHVWQGGMHGVADNMGYGQ